MAVVFMNRKTPDNMMRELSITQTYSRCVTVDFVQTLEVSKSARRLCYCRCPVIKKKGS